MEKTVITLATLSQATAQEVFDQVAAHLLHQGEKSQTGRKCYYRSMNDKGDVLACAAGCLVADDEYSESMESNGWETLEDENPEIYSSDHDYLIRLLQGLHDAAPVDRWEYELYKLANDEGLVFDKERLLTFPKLTFTIPIK
jgi:hypothetical protein